MRQLYRVLPIVLSVGIFGCSNNTSTQTNASSDSVIPTEKRDEFVSKLPDSAPTMKVAMTGDLPPFSFQDDYGNMQGTDVDSIRAIGEEQGFKVEFYKEPWDSLFDSVESGKRDLAISGISYTDERATKYGISDPYFFNPSAIMYSNSDLTTNGLGSILRNIKGIEDIKGLHMGAVENTRQADLLKKMGEDIELSTQATSFLTYESLMQSNTDAIIDDLDVLKYTANRYPEYEVTIIPYENEDAPSAQKVILMAQGNAQLINSVNKGITKLKAKGAFEEIEKHWLGEIATASKTAASKTADATTEQAN